jgi:hypothetical protein
MEQRTPHAPVFYSFHPGPVPISSAVEFFQKKQPLS